MPGGCIRSRIHTLLREEYIVLVTKIIARLRIWASYVAMVSAGFVSFLFFRFPFNFTHVWGRNNIPRRGERVLFVSNHITMYDSFLIAVAAYFPRNIFYPSLPFMNFAARENFFRSWFSKTLFTLLRTVPVERRDHPWLMRKYVDFLARNNLLIFYQGTRSDDLSEPFYWKPAAPTATPLAVPLHRTVDWFRTARTADENLVPMGALCSSHLRVPRKTARASCETRAVCPLRVSGFLRLLTAPTPARWA